MYAASPVILTVVQIAGPCLAPDLYKHPVLGALEMGKDERLAVTLLVEVGVVVEGEPILGVEGDLTHVLFIRWVLWTGQSHLHKI